MASKNMESINVEFVNSLIRVERNFYKNTLRKTCNRNIMDMESIQNIPNPQNNTYKIQPIKMDAQICTDMNNKITSTMQHKSHKPLKYVNNFSNNSLGNNIFHNNIIFKQQTHMKLLRKYFNLWKIKWIHTRNTKNLKKLQDDHRLKITNFLEVLQKRKESIEREEKMKPKLTRSANMKSKKFTIFRKTCSAPSLTKINHLEDDKLNIIENDINKSIIETKNEMKALTLPKLKSCFVKISESNTKPKLYAKEPETLLKSKELAKQREEKRIILFEKKQMLVEKIRRTLEEAELTQKRIELEYKKQKLEEYKDKKRKEDEKADRILKEKLRKIELFQKSKDHFNMKLKQRYFNKFKQLRENTVVKVHTAAEFYEINLLQKHFIRWKRRIQDGLQKMYSKADEHYQRKILIRNFQTWTEKYHVSVLKNQVATDFYEFKLIPRIFGLWHEFTCLQYIHWQDLKGTAIVHYKCTLKARYFLNWKKYITISKKDKEKEKRLQKWIRRVQEILPNFEPVRD